MTSDAQPAEGTTVPTYRPREYQLEMLEASLRENIIVAVRSLYLAVLTTILTSASRWEQAVVRHRCMCAFQLPRILDITSTRSGIGISSQQVPFFRQ